MIDWTSHMLSMCVCSPIFCPSQIVRGLSTESIVPLLVLYCFDRRHIVVINFIGVFISNKCFNIWLILRLPLLLRVMIKIFSIGVFSLIWLYVVVWIITVSMAIVFITLFPSVVWIPSKVTSLVLGMSTCSMSLAFEWHRRFDT